MVDRVALGSWGEDVAVQHLQDQGYVVLARNWRCRDGELDVVALGGGVLAFVEVKTRSGLGYGDPAEAVTAQKARRIRGLAGRWLTECRPLGAFDLRFDVVGVLRQRTGPPVVTHLRGVF